MAFKGKAHERLPGIIEGLGLSIDHSGGGGGDEWDMRVKQLESFKKLHGHAGVPANFKENPALGRWITLQRQR